MQNDLRVTLIQCDLIWENSSANYQHFENLFGDIKPQTDLIILPEMFTSGFSMNTSISERVDENMPTLVFMRKWAAKLNCAIVGSVSVNENDCFYNRLFFVKPDGIVLSYDKRHLFRMADEHKHYSPGSQHLIVEWKGWKIRPLVCYDLRFPVWSRNTLDESQNHHYDILIYLANWPSPRKHAWRSLLPARAIENQSYCFGVNRVGVDGMGFDYAGDSLALDYKGELMADAGSDANSVHCTISFSEMQSFRTKFPVLKDADNFKIY
ncbi:MAG: amidohydrolase [Flavobacteriales bacterium]|nr:amidohydrolase [Flavobacteriales bacterium]